MWVGGEEGHHTCQQPRQGHHINIPPSSSHARQSKKKSMTVGTSISLLSWLEGKKSEQEGGTLADWRLYGSGFGSWDDWWWTRFDVMITLRSQCFISSRGRGMVFVKIYSCLCFLENNILVQLTIKTNISDHAFANPSLMQKWQKYIFAYSCLGFLKNNILVQLTIKTTIQFMLLLIPA